MTHGVLKTSQFWLVITGNHYQFPVGFGWAGPFNCNICSKQTTNYVLLPDGFILTIPKPVLESWVNEHHGQSMKLSGQSYGIRFSQYCITGPRPSLHFCTLCPGDPTLGPLAFSSRSAQPLSAAARRENDAECCEMEKYAKIFCDIFARVSVKNFLHLDRSASFYMHIEIF